MLIDSIRIQDKSSFRDSESQSKISVPKWFLDLIGDAETEEEVHDCIIRMMLSGEEDLCKRKSINLAEVRARIIEHENEKISKKKVKQR
jgi:hypothetical protein